MQTLVTSEQIRKLESELIEKSNSNLSLTLMEKAGSGLAEAIKEYSDPILIVCGKGNNGGDGLVAARYLHKSGKKVLVCLTSEESLLSKDAKANFEKIKTEIKHIIIKGENDTSFTNELKASNTVIDCLLGTGTNKQASSFYDWIIKTINDSHKTIIACDIPTGVNPDTGNINEHTIKAKVTVTFGYPKIGLVVFPGKKYAGIIKTINIGLPEIESNYTLLDDEFLKTNLPKRYEDSNKSTFGRTLLVCGSKKYPGAALLSSKASAAIGSGLTSLASPEEVLIKITPVMPEVTHIEFNQTKILEESLNASVLVIGPGLTTETEIKNLVENLITKAATPIVLDADGINVISKNKEFLKKAKNKVVITPHPKELARLLNITLEEVLSNKLELAKNTASELNCTLVLKGPATIIATKDKKVFISPFANAALAKGGTGDILAGFIGGLISQKLEPSIAACVGVYLHGKTGEMVARDKTVFSLLPQDLIAYLPIALKEYL